VETVLFRPDRTILAVALIAFLGAIPVALSSFYLAPAFLVPVGMIVWGLRARVGADTTGLEICNGLGVQRVAWDAIDRFEIPDRGPVLLHSVTGATLRLTALARRDLPAILEVSKN
jgi:hypothetical protein